MAMNMDAVLRIVAEVSGTAELSKLQKGIAGAEKAAKDARSAFTSVTSSATWQAAAVGATALGAGLALSVRTGMEFEKAMSGVAAKVGGTATEIGRLNELAQDLGRKTQFSAKQSAEGMDFLAMAGFKTNEIVAAMPGLLNLAAAGQLELGMAADIASNILGGMNMKAEETGRVADVLAKAATSSNVSVEMLGETFKYVAPVAAQAGASLEEMAAAAGLLGDAGIQGSEAGTGLRSVLLRLAAPPEEAAKALNKLGISTKDAAGNLRPFGDILAEVDRKMKDMNMGTGDQLEIQEALFGKTAIATGAILQQAAANGTLAEKTQLLENAQGSAAKMAETMNDNMAGSFKRLESAIEGFQIALTSDANPALQDVIDGLADLINLVTDLMKRFPGLSTAVLVLSAAFIGLVAAAPFIVAFIKIVGSLKAALAIGGLAAAWAGIQTVVIVAVAGMKTALLGLLTWVGGTLVPGLLAAMGPAGWTVLAVAAVVTMAIAFRKPIMDFLAWLPDALRAGFDAGWEAVVNGFSVISEAFNNYVATPISKAWTAVVEFLPKAMMAARDGVVKIWTSVIDTVKNVFRSVLQFVANGINSIIERINYLIRGYNNIPYARDIPQLKYASVPRFAKGGFVTSPTLAEIGEGGEPEYVVPQSKATSFANNIIAGRTGTAALSGSRSSPTTIGGGRSGGMRTITAATSTAAAPAAAAASVAINVQTGPVMEFNGERYVTMDAFERGMRATADGVIGRLRTPAARRALGR